jgi:hypothetical protein
LLLNYLLVLLFLLDALLDSDAFHLLLVILNFGIHTLHFEIDLLDDGVYLFDLLLKGFGFGFKVLKGRFRGSFNLELLETLGESFYAVCMLVELGR